MYAKPSKIKLLKKRIYSHKVLYLMFLPCIVYFILFEYIPMAGVYTAFTDFSFTKGIFGSPFVGLKYFKAFFNSYDAPRLIKNTLIIGFMKSVLEFPFAILLALMLNELKSPRYKKITQTISYLPHFMSSVIVITMLQRMLAPNVGTINKIIGAFGGDSSKFFLMEKKYFLPILFSLDIWKNIGWNSIIYLAAISGVDVALHEAAQIDGCSKMKRIWHITLPGIRNTIGVLFILGIGGLLSSGFEQIYLLRTPGNMEIADTLDIYVVRTGISNAQFGYATAIGLIQGLVGLMLVVISNRISKKVTEVGIW